jgi:GH15 family glucan-1,4-alpha-glucosidase
LRGATLEQLAEGEFAEYYEPFSGEPLGARHQSWTAAAVLDWLCG